MRASFCVKAVIIAVAAVLVTVSAEHRAIQAKYYLHDTEIAVTSAERNVLLTLEKEAKLSDLFRVVSALHSQDHSRITDCNAVVNGAHRLEDVSMRASDVLKSNATLTLVCVGARRPVELKPLKVDMSGERNRDRDSSAIERLLRDEAFIERSKQYYMQRMSQNVSQQYPFTAEQIEAETLDAVIAWAYQFVTHHWGPLHPFPSYSGVGTDTGIYYLNTGEELSKTGQCNAKSCGGDEMIRVALTADWGAGTQEADYVSELMVTNFASHYTIHVGDVYLVGTPQEVASNCLGQAPPNAQQGVTWRHGSIGSFALNGNHETYSRCYGYFDHFLPTLGIDNAKTGKPSGQKASYFMLENEYWRMISLDTGYNTYSKLFESSNNTQPDEVIDWLSNVVNISNPEDTRGIIFLSHHQYMSAFDKPYTATPQQLADLVPANRTVLWLWGHEHRLGFYERGTVPDIALEAYGRCIGVGGFPVSLSNVPPKARESGLMVYDDRQYTTLSGWHPTRIGFNGFSHLTFNGTSLEISYSSLQLDSQGNLSNTNSTLLLVESYVADLSSGNVRLQNFNIIDSDLTVVQHL